jgi:uncharacterized protein (TIGR02145 family)
MQDNPKFAGIKFHHMLHTNTAQSIAMAAVLSCFLLSGARAQVTDIDGNTYTTVQDVNENTWFARNLSVTRFRNGDPIRECKTFQEWRQANLNGEPAWCYYEFDKANDAKHGKLYNWFAVVDSRGLAPAGFMIADEWKLKELLQEGSSNRTYQGNAIEFLNEGETWEVDCAQGVNESGFTGTASGYIRYNKSANEFYFDGKGTTAIWWLFMFYKYDYKHPGAFKIYSKEGELIGFEEGKPKYEPNECKTDLLPSRYTGEQAYVYDGYSVRPMQPKGYKSPGELIMKAYSMPFVGNQVRMNAVFDTQLDSVKITTLTLEGKVFIRNFNPEKDRYSPRYTSLDWPEDDLQPLNAGFRVDDTRYLLYSRHLIVMYDFMQQSAIIEFNTKPNEIVLECVLFNNQILSYTYNQTSGEVSVGVFDPAKPSIVATIPVQTIDPASYLVTDICATSAGSTAVLYKHRTKPAENGLSYFSINADVLKSKSLNPGTVYKETVGINLPEKVLDYRQDETKLQLNFTRTKGDYTVIQSLSLYMGGSQFMADFYPKDNEIQYVYNAGPNDVFFGGNRKEQASKYFVSSFYAISKPLNNNKGIPMLRSFFSDLSSDNYSMDLYARLKFTGNDPDALKNYSFSRILGIIWFGGNCYYVTEWTNAEKAGNFYYFAIKNFD